MKKLILIDANALIHRAFHALPPLKAPSGLMTNAIFGFSSTLLKMLKDLEPDYIVAAYDLGKPTFRHKAFKEYKIHRAKVPDEFISQLPYTKKVLNAFGVPTLEMERYEADDLIGSLAEKFKEEGNIQVIIVTGDLDALQLVDNKRVLVYTMKRGLSDTIIYDEKAVMSRYGLKPEQLTDYRGLKGDPSDNIPGVKGIGEKTAIELLQKFDSIEKLYENLETADLKASVKKKLQENKEQAMLSKNLATIVRDLDMDIDLEKADWRKNFDRNALENLFKELNFSSLIPRIPQIGKLSFAKVTEGEEIKKVIIPKDLGGLEKKIQIAAWLLNSELKEPTLDEIYFAEFGQAVPGGRYEKNNLQKLYDVLWDKLKAANLLKVFEEIELPLIPVLAEMEQNGIKVDKKAISNLDEFVSKELREHEGKIYEEAGVQFNVNSPQQLGEILFNRLKIRGRVRKTAGGAISTAASELEKIREEHPIVDLVLKYRELQKLKTTYIDPFPQLIDPKDGRIHTTYIQTGTVTGRLASQNPNLQNIPIKTELGQKFREAFVAEKGYKLISLDYSQLELRIAAHLSGDEKMIKAFERGEDIHLKTAAEVFDVSPEIVTPRMRREAKALNFGIIYGMGPLGFARSAGITQKEAKQFIEKYFEEFPGISRYMESRRTEAHDKGVVKNTFGRRRQLNEIYSSIPEMVRQAERMAINFPIQSIAADLTKLAMIGIWKYIHKHYPPAGGNGEVKMLLQVHDEIVLEAKENLAEKVAEELKKIMEGVYKLDAPLVAEAKIADNWAYA